MAILLGAAALLTMIGSRKHIDTCSQIGLPMSMGLLVLSALLMVVSLLFGGRVALRLLIVERDPDWSPRADPMLDCRDEAQENGRTATGSHGARGTLAHLQRSRTLSWTQKFKSTHCLLILLAAVILALMIWVWDNYGQYPVFASELDARWGPVFNGQAKESDRAPLWVGEFGTDADNLWWQYIIQYIGDQDVDWAYWSINGERYVNESEEYGLLMEDSLTVRHPWKLHALQALMKRQSAMDEW